jgi:thiol-disulfide isomerase/thioredoxin
MILIAFNFTFHRSSIPFSLEKQGPKHRIHLTTWRSNARRSTSIDPLIVELQSSQQSRLTRKIAPFRSSHKRLDAEEMEIRSAPQWQFLRSQPPFSTCTLDLVFAVQTNWTPLPNERFAMTIRRFTCWLTALAAISSLIPKTVTAANPTADQALQFASVQRDVEYDKPTAAEVPKCSLAAEKVGSASGWVVRSDSGQLLRRFLDTNQDHKVDQWCYFKDGIEVYRDIDQDFNGKADQYRWMGTAGIRWGLDPDENTKIDSWKVISVEEVTAEIVAAVRAKDQQRFDRLLLTELELKALELGDDQTKELGDKIRAAKLNFAKFAAIQTTIQSNSKWLHFGGSRPGLIPAGTRESKKDVVVYENVAAVVSNGKDHGQVAIGTLIQVGNVWRAVTLPQQPTASTVQSEPNSFFFMANLKRPDEVIPDATDPQTTVDEQTQKLIEQLEGIDKRLSIATTPVAQAKLNRERADVLESLSKQSAQPEQENWIRQYADSVSAAVQSGGYPEGTTRLGKLLQSSEEDKRSESLIGYVKFLTLTASYAQSLQVADADFAKIQEQWLSDLKVFVAKYPKLTDSAEAMLQLALAQEFAGETADAIKWYGRIVTDFPTSDQAKKAGGARHRLESVGRSITLKGKTIDGKQLDLAAYRGRYVVVQYWASWCEPCKKDMAELKRLQAKFGSKTLSIIGVNLDNDSSQVSAQLRSLRVTWPQLHEAGGLDSRYANEMGILTLPTMLLIDNSGRVLNRNIHVAEVDSELGKRVRRK